MASTEEDLRLVEFLIGAPALVVDITLEDLVRSYDNRFLAIGAHHQHRLNIGPYSHNATTGLTNTNMDIELGDVIWQMLARLVIASQHPRVQAVLALRNTTFLDIVRPQLKPIIVRSLDVSCSMHNRCLDMPGLTAHTHNMRHLSFVTQIPWPHGGLPPIWVLQLLGDTHRFPNLHSVRIRIFAAYPDGTLAGLQDINVANYTSFAVRRFVWIARQINATIREMEVVGYGGVIRLQDIEATGTAVGKSDGGAALYLLANQGRMIRV